MGSYDVSDIPLPVQANFLLMCVDLSSLGTLSTSIPVWHSSCEHSNLVSVWHSNLVRVWRLRFSLSLRRMRQNFCRISSRAEGTGWISDLPDWHAEVFSTGQLTSRHFMFVWEEKFAPKANMSALFSLLLQSLVLVRQLCTPLFYSVTAFWWPEEVAPSDWTFVVLPAFASFARSALRGCLVRSSERTNTDLRAYGVCPVKSVLVRSKGRLISEKVESEKIWNTLPVLKRPLGEFLSSRRDTRQIQQLFSVENCWTSS
jgi:hypothetical protein